MSKNSRLRTQRDCRPDRSRHLRHRGRSPEVTLQSKAFRQTTRRFPNKPRGLSPMSWARTTSAFSTGFPQTSRRHHPAASRLPDRPPGATWRIDDPDRRPLHHHRGIYPNRFMHVRTAADKELFRLKATPLTAQVNCLPQVASDCASAALILAAFAQGDTGSASTTSTVVTSA